MSSKNGKKQVVETARAWLGFNEEDGSHREIIDVYNSYRMDLPRHLKMQYDWAWCAAFWSAIAIKLDLADWCMPIEMSCYYLVERAKSMGCWVEDDNYVPSPGDAILYSWGDDGIGDNVKSPNHVGVVEYVSDGYIVVIEGNNGNAVRRRTISLNGLYIRGFITPPYPAEADEEVSLPGVTDEVLSVEQAAHEVITGLWGNGEERKTRLTEAGYDYAEVQALVNKILNTPMQKTDKQIEECETVATTYADYFSRDIAGTYRVNVEGGLYCRNDAGSNKKALTVIPNGTRVKCYGYYSMSGGNQWPYVKFTLDSMTYIGFVCGKYLVKE